jgi:para-aminobenzoate synthetase
VLVGLDGGAGAGKSTLAAAAAAATAGLSVITADDFYVGFRGEEWDAMTLSEQSDRCMDWRRQRVVLEALSRGQEASWQPYDWEADDGRLQDRWLRCEPTRIVILEGVYSTRPELADLLDLRVLLDVPDDARRERIRVREGEGYREEWEARWFAAEAYYLEHVMPSAAFDLVLRSPNGSALP